MALHLPDPENKWQEKASLIKGAGSFKKIVLVRDVVKTIHDEWGILTMSAYDFMLNTNSLD